MSQDRDIEGLTAILGECLVTRESNLNGMPFNYHQAWTPRALYIGEFDAIALGGDGDDFYEVEVHANALFDRLEAFFAARAAA